MSKINICFKYLLLVLFLIVLPGCTGVPNEEHTPIPTHRQVLIVIPPQLKSPTSSITASPSMGVKPIPTSTIQPTIQPTDVKNTPCEMDFFCTKSPDGMLFAEGVGWSTGGIGIKPEEKPFIRILTVDGNIIQTIYYDEKIKDYRLWYVPWKFDSESKWLYASLEFDGFAGDGISGGLIWKIPSSYGLVKINILTGEIKNILYKNEYYGMKFSPDGSKLAYTLVYTIGILDLKYETRNLYSISYQVAKNIIWSPDSTQFAIVGIKNFDIDPDKVDIFVFSPVNQQPVQIIFSHIWPVYIQEWNQQNGLVFETNNQNRKQVWQAMNPTNISPIQITNP
jgi:hypothetical protein